MVAEMENRIQGNLAEAKKLLRGWDHSTGISVDLQDAVRLASMAIEVAYRRAGEDRKRKELAASKEPVAGYPMDDWAHEVKDGNTHMGYQEWVQHKKEAG